MSKLEPMGDRRDRAQTRGMIEENLQKVYQTLLQEDVPDRFRDLLDRLRAQGTPADAARTEPGADAPPAKDGPLAEDGQ